MFKPYKPPTIDDRAFWEGVGSDPDLVPLVAEIERVAEGAAERPAPPLASDFLAARRHNDRARLDRWWQSGRRELAALAVRRCLRGVDDADADDRLLDHLWVHVTQPTWVVSAHLPDKDLPLAGRPEIDLASSMMAADLSEFCEVLGPWIRSVSGTLFEAIVHEIDRRVLAPYASDYMPSWETGGGNWPGVCAGSILTACLALEALGLPRPAAQERALRAINRYLTVGFTPGGECDEGLGYWNYGIGCAVGALMRLNAQTYAGGIDRDRLRVVASYPEKAHIHGDCFFAGNDAGMENSCPLWLAGFFDDAEDLPWNYHWARHLGPAELGPLSSTLRALHGPRRLEVPAAAGRGSEATLLKDQQAGILRLDGPWGGMIGILSGGTNCEAHNHNDLGQFQIIVGGTPIIIDLGSPEYTSDFFGPRRYEYLAASSRGHCCPIINGREQRAGCDAHGEVLEWSPEGGRLTLELSRAYPEDAGLRRWTRCLQREADGLSLTDDFTLSAPDAPVISRFWTTHAPRPVTPGRIELGPVVVHVTPPPSALQVQQVAPSAERLRSWGGQTLYGVDLVYAAADDGRLTTTMRFTPPGYSV